MSTAWKGGSTRAWRKIRAFVLLRDGWICQLCNRTINPRLRPPHPQSASVHHTQGKANGDDPAYLQAAHRLCNAKVGDPTAAPDPTPQPRTRW